MIPKKQHIENHYASDDVAYSEGSRSVPVGRIECLPARAHRSYRLGPAVGLALVLAILALPIIWLGGLQSGTIAPNQLEPIVSELYSFFQDEKGVDVRNDLGVTSLMRASLVGRAEEVLDLIDKGANVNARDKDGETALMAASFSGYPEVVQILVETGAEVNAKSRSGATALSIATQNKQSEVISVLRQNGATF